MVGIPRQRALWHAAVTVLLAALIVAGFILYIVAPHRGDWLAISIIIAAPSLVLFPLVYRRYHLGPKPLASPREQTTTGMAMGFAALPYAIDCLADPKPGLRGISRWGIAASWLLIAVNNLWQAHRAGENRRRSHAP